MSDWPFILGFARKHRGETMAMATLVDRQGASYRLPGARLLATADGTYCGSLSGGCLEESIAAIARQVIASGKPRIENIDTRPHFGCPGKLRILIEPVPRHGLLDDIDARITRRESFRITTTRDCTRIGDHACPSDGMLVENVTPAPRLVAIGGTSDLEPLFQIARIISWDCHRVLRDTRQAEGIHPVAGESIHCVSPDELLRTFTPDRSTAVIVMSHHLATDLAYLKSALPGNYGYIGLLGSRRRRETLLGELGESGMLENPEWIDRFHAPVGIDIGASHPSTIALSIVAEIQAVLTGNSSGFLRDRLGTIHLPT